MDARELSAEKEKLERQIGHLAREAIIDFKKRSGIAVVGINIDFMSDPEAIDPTPSIYSVTAHLQL